MPYSSTTWANGVAPAINAGNLNNIEAGLVNLQAVLGRSVETLTSAAIQIEIDAVSAAGGGTVLLKPTTYLLTSTLSVPRDVNLIGSSVPGTDPTNPPLATIIKRTADVNGFDLVGTNRSSDRVGHNLFRGIQFLDSTNLSSKPMFNCKYADSLMFENCTFWQPDNQTISGNFIYAEECWDWRFWNVNFKHYGNAATSCIKIYNGTTDACNGWKWFACRWQEGVGKAIEFDSSGNVSVINFDFEFYGCKFEDTGNQALTFISGTCKDLHMFGGQVAGCGERKISQPSTSTRWVIDGTQFANGGNTPTEMVELLGNRSGLVRCSFQNPGSGIVQYINVTGAENEVTGCLRASTTLPLANTSGVAVTTKIHHNPDFLTEYSSTAQITSGNTSVTVTHGMGYTPSNHHIMVTPHSSLGSASTFWVSAVGATTFQINVNANPAATVTFAWQVQRTRG